MKNLLLKKTRKLNDKLYVLLDKTNSLVEKQKRKIRKLYYTTTCHIYRDILDHYYLHLVMFEEYNKDIITLIDTPTEEDYISIHSDLFNLSRSYLMLNWLEQFFTKYRKELVEPENAGLANGIKASITSIFRHRHSLSDNNEARSIKQVLTNVREYQESILSVGNQTVRELGLSYWIQRNYMLDIGKQRSKFILPDYDIEKPEFDFNYNLTGFLETIDTMSKNINKKELYDSFIYEYNDNTDHLSTDEDIIGFELSKSSVKNVYGDRYDNSLYSNTLEEVLNTQKPNDLYALDLLYYFVDRWQVSHKSLGINSSQNQFIFNILNILDTETTIEILRRDEDKFPHKQQERINEESYNVSVVYINNELLKVIHMFLHNLEEEASDKLEKVLRTLYNAVGAREMNYSEQIL